MNGKKSKLYNKYLYLKKANYENSRNISNAHQDSLRVHRDDERKDTSAREESKRTRNQK